MQIIKKLKQKTNLLKSEMQVLIIAYKDKRTPLAAKILIAVTVGYLLSPVDLIPDFIPVLGLLDDVIIVPLLVTFSIKLIPKIVLSEAREVVKVSSVKYRKNNWIVASVIIGVWLMIIFFIYRSFNFK